MERFGGAEPPEERRETNDAGERAARGAEAARRCAQLALEHGRPAREVQQLRLQAAGLARTREHGALELRWVRAQCESERTNAARQKAELESYRALARNQDCFVQSLREKCTCGAGRAAQRQQNAAGAADAHNDAQMQITAGIVQMQPPSALRSARPSDELKEKLEQLKR